MPLKHCCCDIVRERNQGIYSDPRFNGFDRVSIGLIIRWPRMGLHIQYQGVSHSGQVKTVFHPEGHVAESQCIQGRD